MREIIAGALIAAVLLVAAAWPAANTPSAPAPARCVGTEDQLGWVPLRCGNYQGYTSGWWYADWMN